MEESRPPILDVDVDVAVIGAGLAGITFARFYLETHNSCRLAILEQDKVLGGVWSSARVFDAFWTQSPLRQSYISDVPIQLPSDAPTNHDMFGAKNITRYLEEYVDTHVYEGKSIRDRIRFSSEVQSMEKAGANWILRFTSESKSHRVTCSKVIVATGITTIPLVPACLLDEGCPIEAVHHRNFGAEAARLFAAESGYDNMTVFGAGKSAADMAYAAAKAGRRVNWLVRKSEGEGPGLFFPAAAPKPYRHVGEAMNTLAASVLLPSAFKPLGGYASQLNFSKTSEAKILQKIEANNQRCKADANYRNRIGALPGFVDLEPTASTFWVTAPTGAPQHADFWEVVSKQVHVYRGDIAAMTPGLITLEDGRSVPTDVALCGTGWSAACPFLTPEQIRNFGLPHTLSLPPEEQKEWDQLLRDADQAILQTYPILRRSITVSQKSMSPALTPSRLFRGIAPLHDDSVLFLGRVRVGNSFRTNEAQAIWATAYLDGHVKLSLEERKRDVAWHSIFSKRRYPARGGSGLDLYSDIIWYTERLVSEAGLESHRKDWWYDWNAPTLQSDFADCKDEYIRKYGGTPNGKAG